MFLSGPSQTNLPSTTVLSHIALQRVLVVTLARNAELNRLQDPSLVCRPQYALLTSSSQRALCPTRDYTRCVRRRRLHRPRLVGAVDVRAVSIHLARLAVIALLRKRGRTGLCPRSGRKAGKDGEDETLDHRKAGADYSCVGFDD